MMRAVLPRWSQSGTDTDNLRDPEALPTIVDAQMPFPRCCKVTRSLCHLFRSHSEEQRMDSWIHMEKSRKPIAEIALATPSRGESKTCTSRGAVC